MRTLIAINVLALAATACSAPSANDEEIATASHALTYGGPAQSGYYLIANITQRNDDRGTIVTGDWAYGQNKAEGDARSALTGLATPNWSLVSVGFDGGGTTPLYAQFRTDVAAQDHLYTPSSASPASCYRRDWGNVDNRFLQAGDDPIAVSDWDLNHYKIQCGKNEYVAGVGQDYYQNASSVLCCFNDDLARVRRSCRVSYLGGSSEQNNGGAWAGNIATAQCGEGRTVAGISKDVSGVGFNPRMGAHAILCCE